MSSNSRAGLSLLGLLIFSVLGCRPATDEQKLLVYCGAGIRPPVAEVAEQFGDLHGVTVECDYAGSELLLSRIELSGQGDVYIPGDVHYVDQADQEDLVADREMICYFIPVILVAKGNPKNILTLEDLLRPDVRLGLGDAEACAIGRKAAKIFEKNGFEPEVVEKRVAFRSLTVNELANNVKLESLDAVIVWDAVAATVAEEGEIVPIPVERNVISTVVAGTLTTSENPTLAAKFLEFLASDKGRAVFEKHHYSLTLPE